MMKKYITTRSEEEDRFHPADLLTSRQTPIRVSDSDESPRKQADTKSVLATVFQAYRHSDTRSRSGRVAQMMARCRNIVLPYPRHIDGFAELDELRLFGIATHGQPQLGLAIFDPPQTGKTTLAVQYKALSELDADEGQRPVVLGGVGVGGTASELYISILSQLGDDVVGGSLNGLRRRAFDALRDAGTELLIIDESQDGGTKSGIDAEILSEVKIILDEGLLPVVLLGTRDALEVLRRNVPLSRRMFSPFSLAPLNWAETEDREIWTQFLSRFDLEMVERGIVAEPAGFSTIKDLAKTLCEMCGGVIGEFTRLVLMALREAIRDGRDRIELEDLAFAGDEWSLRAEGDQPNPLWVLVDGRCDEEEQNANAAG